MNNNIDIKKVIEYINNINNQFYRSEYTDKTSININLSSSIHNYGIVKALLLNNDQIVVNFIKHNINTSSLNELTKQYCKKYNRDWEIQLYRANSNIKYTKIEYKSSDNIIGWDNRTNKILQDTNLKENKEKINFIYLYLQYYFNNYCDYINTKVEEVLLNKYGLFDITDDMQIYNRYDPARIYNEKLNKTIILDINKNIIDLFYKLKKEKLISKISLRVKKHYIFNGKNIKQSIKHGLQCGVYFMFNIEKLTNLSFLYSTNCDNYLYIVKDKNNITFEEFSNYDNESDIIKSHILHFQYKNNVITHLDEEYVFYDKNQYKNKQSNIKEKGTAIPKYKLFKLDDCIIPFNYPCKDFLRGKEKIVPFIFYIVNTLFYNSDLVYEYFQNVISKI